MRIEVLEPETSARVKVAVVEEPGDQYNWPTSFATLMLDGHAMSSAMMQLVASHINSGNIKLPEGVR